jgi:hypothetical protein
LKDNDAILFWSTVSEIKVGMWLENQQIDLICFQPPASNGGKGDFLVNIGDINVFVEVKTKFGDRYMLEQERLVRRIAQHFKVLRLPVHSVVLRFEPLTAQCQSVDAYLCPNPKFRLPISYLLQNGILWWQLDNDGTIVKLVFNS